jgi:hypothetical protein
MRSLLDMTDSASLETGLRGSNVSDTSNDEPVWLPYSPPYRIVIKHVCQRRA